MSDSQKEIYQERLTRLMAGRDTQLEICTLLDDIALASSYPFTRTVAEAASRSIADIASDASDLPGVRDRLADTVRALHYSQQELNRALDEVARLEVKLSAAGKEAA